MPLRVVEHDALRGVRAGWIAEGEKLQLNRIEGCGLGRTAVLVERVELLGELGGSLRIPGEKEVDYVGGDVHPPGGVDARSEAETYFRRRGSPVEREFGNLHQGAEAGLDRVREGAETKRDDGSVFAQERDRVGDGRDGDELEEAGDEDVTEAVLFGNRADVRREQGVRQFEGDAGPAEMFVRVRAVRLGRVDDGEGFGKSGGAVGQVVVGDDEVETQGPGFFSGGEGANAGVNRDDEADAGGGGFGQAYGLHAVALAQAVRDVERDDGGLFGRCDALDGGLEQHRGGGAVNVVVAIDEDGFGVADRALNAGDRTRHAKQEEGIVEVVQGGIEEVEGRIRVCNAAGDENGGYCGGAQDCSGQGVDGYVMGVREEPAGLGHENNQGLPSCKHRLPEANSGCLRSPIAIRRRSFDHKAGRQRITSQVPGPSEQHGNCGPAASLFCTRHKPGKSLCPARCPPLSSRIGADDSPAHLRAVPYIAHRRSHRLLRRHPSLAWYGADGPRGSASPSPAVSCPRKPQRHGGDRPAHRLLRVVYDGALLGRPHLRDARDCLRQCPDRAAQPFLAARNALLVAMARHPPAHLGGRIRGESPGTHRAEAGRRAASAHHQLGDRPLMHTTPPPIAWACITLVAALAIAGEVLIAAAMRKVGDLDRIRAVSGLPGAIRAVLASPAFLAGATCMAFNFFAMLYTLSRVDLSLAAPGIASFNYVGNAVAARFFLRENVDRRRWLAVLFVAVGVLLLTK